MDNFEAKLSSYNNNELIQLVPGCSSHFGIDSTFGEDSIIEYLDDIIDEREERDISSSCESV